MSNPRQKYTVRLQYDCKWNVDDSFCDIFEYWSTEEFARILQLQGVDRDEDENIDWQKIRTLVDSGILDKDTLIWSGNSDREIPLSWIVNTYAKFEY